MVVSMLLDLNILNGVLSPSFDLYVDTYTVSVENDIESLIIDYKVEDSYTVEIINNSLDDGDNFVYLEVKGNDEINIYTLEVYKEYSNTVFESIDYSKPLEVNKEMPSYIKPMIIGSCIFVILLVFLLLFKRKKVHKK